MSDAPSASAATTPGSTSRLGWTSLLMGVAPLALVAVSLVTGPGSEPLEAHGQFEPARSTWLLCWGLGALYAARLVVVLERYRLARGGQFGGSGARKGFASFGSVLVVGLFIWVWSSPAIAVFALGHVHDWTGQARIEQGTVQDKWVTKGKGCHFHVQVVGPTVASRTTLCVYEARWNRVETDGPLPLVVSQSWLGRRVDVGPEAGTDPGGHGHE